MLYSLHKPSLSVFATLVFLALVNFSIFCTSILFGYKLVPFLGITISASIYAFPFSYVCGDIITEIFGYHISRIVIWTTFACLLLFSTFVTFLLNLTPVPAWHDQASYEHVLSGVYRLSLAIIFSLIIGDFVNAFILSKWKLMLNGRSFWLRSFGATAIGEAIDTLIGLGITFAGQIALTKFLKIILAAYMIKIFVNSVFIIPSSIIVAFLKKKLQLDVFDNDINYNPFRLALSKS